MYQSKNKQYSKTGSRQPRPITSQVWLPYHETGIGWGKGRNLVVECWSTGTDNKKRGDEKRVI